MPRSYIVVAPFWTFLHMPGRWELGHSLMLFSEASARVCTQCRAIFSACDSIFSFHARSRCCVGQVVIILNIVDLKPKQFHFSRAERRTLALADYIIHKLGCSSFILQLSRTHCKDWKNCSTVLWGLIHKINDRRIIHNSFWRLIFFTIWLFFFIDWLPRWENSWVNLSKFSS